MNITKDTPLSELMHSDDELMHYKYIKKEQLPSGEWRYYYLETDHRVMDPNNISNSEGKKKPMTTKQQEQYRSALRTDRYMEAAKEWINSRLRASVVDVLSGKHKPLTWKQAKEVADGWHINDDPKLFISKKYKQQKQ